MTVCSGFGSYVVFFLCHHEENTIGVLNEIMGNL